MNRTLYYLNARYYNADEGEFLSQDTYRGAESDENSWNLYAYCAGNLYVMWIRVDILLKHCLMQ
ncbi:MAG: RHS repeat-associated core domain-containing protein [Eubacterium ventriosum]